MRANPDLDEQNLVAGEMDGAEPEICGLPDGGARR